MTDIKEKTDRESILSADEIELLESIQHGVTSEELAAHFGVGKWNIRFRLNSIKEKLDALGQAQAIRSAMDMGMVPKLKKWSSLKEGFTLLRAGIIGCGRGGSALIDLLKYDDGIDILWVFDKDPNAKGINLAKSLKIKTLSNLQEIRDNNVDVILNLTGSVSVGDELIDLIDLNKTELMGGLSAKLLWRLVDERRKRLDEKERVLREREIFFHLGLLMEKIDNMKDASSAVIDYATRLTSMPSGAIALFNETDEEMHLIASKGLGSEFDSIQRWSINDCFATNSILSSNSNDPITIDNLNDEDGVSTHFIKGGVRSLMAAPFMSEHKVLGIIYVAAPENKTFLSDEINIFSLLCLYATFTFEKVKAIEDIHHLSITDGLTGLCNQRHMMERLENEFKRSQRHNHPFSVLMLDIDHFKNYNDTYGHLEGNQLLQKLSALLIDSARDTDTVARFGGEEFCILLYEVDKAGAHVFAQRLIEKIALATMPNEKITVSAGVAAYPVDAKTHIELLSKSDVNLYKAKQGGRNRVCS